MCLEQKVDNVDFLFQLWVVSASVHVCDEGSRLPADIMVRLAAEE
jgi:hypothetical protein